MSAELCLECSRRSVCRSLCADAERYARQDHVGRDELPLGLVRHGSFPNGSSLYLTDREREILIMLGRGLDRSDICELLNITRPNLRKIIERVRRKAGGGGVKKDARN